MALIDLLLWAWVVISFEVLAVAVHRHFQPRPRYKAGSNIQVGRES